MNCSTRAKAMLSTLPELIMGDGAGCGSKPAMWFDGGIHAREWVSPAVATYMAMELVENDDAHPDLTKELDW